MIKETKALEEVTKRHKFCDVCGAEIDMGLACRAASCMYCKDDLCEECIGYEEESPGDYRVVWCKNCWETGGYFRGYTFDCAGGQAIDIDEMVRLVMENGRPNSREL